MRLAKYFTRSAVVLHALKAAARIMRGVSAGLRAVGLSVLLAAAAFGLAAPDRAAAKGWAEVAGGDELAEGGAFIVHLGKARTLTLPRAARDIVVSNPEVLETTLRTARQPVLFGMRIGQANILFFDDAGREIRALDVRVEYDVADLNRMLKRAFPDETVTASSHLGTITLEGAVRSSLTAASMGAMAQRYVAAIIAAQKGEDVEISSVPIANSLAILNDEQIHLKVRVAEVSRGVLKRLGVDWNAGLESTVLSGTLIFKSAGPTGFVNLQNFVGDIVPQTLETYIKALEEHDMVRTLAEPSLTSVNGEPASFLAGGEFPIPVGRGDDGIEIEFKRFGVGLDFTPAVIGEGRISLKIATEVSELTTEGAITIDSLTVPALTVRRAQTVVEAPSGGTIMIAGLIQQNTRRLSKGLPGLRKLPVLGSFFRVEEVEAEETELVVLVTPYTVKPDEPEKFAAPTDGFAPASDLDIFLFGRLHAVYASDAPDHADGVAVGDHAAGEAVAKSVDAPVGFMME